MPGLVMADRIGTRSSQGLVDHARLDVVRPPPAHRIEKAGHQFHRVLPINRRCAGARADSGEPVQAFQLQHVGIDRAQLTDGIDECALVGQHRLDQSTRPERVRRAPAATRPKAVCWRGVK